MHASVCVCKITNMLARLAGTKNTSSEEETTDGFFFVCFKHSNSSPSSLFFVFCFGPLEIFLFWSLNSQKYYFFFLFLAGEQKMSSMAEKEKNNDSKQFDSDDGGGCWCL